MTVLTEDLIRLVAGDRAVTVTGVKSCCLAAWQMGTGSVTPSPTP